MVLLSKSNKIEEKTNTKSKSKTKTRDTNSFAI
jgi:hypothetical protein